MSQQQFENFTASSLYCEKCKAAMPVRERLLLILPDKEIYDYLCTGCASSVGQREITAGEKMMAEKMDADVMDAAIVGSAQKMEHYEICGYGTARAYAEELGLTDVEKLLKTTLDEEYEADDLLTKLAVRRLNKEATPKKSKSVRQQNRSGKRKSHVKKVSSRSKAAGSTGSTRPSGKKTIAR